LEKYILAAFITLGARISVEIIVGIAIKAKNPSIKFRIKLNEVVAPPIILRM